MFGVHIATSDRLAAAAFTCVRSCHPYPGFCSMALRHRSPTAILQIFDY
jgi:hypothetical protein